MTSLEFEVVSIEDARRELDGEAKQRAEFARNARQAQDPGGVLLEATAAWLASLPDDVRPTRLAEEYPRIANGIARSGRRWPDAGNISNRSPPIRAAAARASRSRSTASSPRSRLITPGCTPTIQGPGSPRARHQLRQQIAQDRTTAALDRRRTGAAISVPRRRSIAGCSARFGGARGAATLAARARRGKRPALRQASAGFRSAPLPARTAARP